MADYDIIELRSLTGNSRHYYGMYYVRGTGAGYHHFHYNRKTAQFVFMDKLNDGRETNKWGAVGIDNRNPDFYLKLSSSCAVLSKNANRVMQRKIYYSTCREITMYLLKHT